MNNSIDLALNELQYIPPPVSDPMVLNEFISVALLNPKLGVVGLHFYAPTYSNKPVDVLFCAVNCISPVDVLEALEVAVNVKKNAL